MHSRYLAGRSTAAAPGVVWALAYLAKASVFAHGGRSNLLWLDAVLMDSKFDLPGILPGGLILSRQDAGMSAGDHRVYRGSITGVCGSMPVGMRRSGSVQLFDEEPALRFASGSGVSAPAFRAPEGTALPSSQEAHRRRLCGRVRTERHRRKDRTRKGKAGKRPEAFSEGIGQGRRGGIHRIQTLRHGQPASAMLTTQGKMSRFLPVQISAACRRRLCPFILVCRAGYRSGAAALN